MLDAMHPLEREEAPGSVLDHRLVACGGERGGAEAFGKVDDADRQADVADQLRRLQRRQANPGELG